MAKPGAYISDLNLLEELDCRIGRSSEEMRDIDANVVSYLGSVRENLQRGMDIIRGRLNEAQQRLSRAEAALSACQASQSSAMAMGMMCPTCIVEEQEVEMARMEVEKWRMRESHGQQIVGDCEREIGEYNGSGGGHGLILTMCEEQTPKARELLRGCIDKLQDVLGSNMGVSAGSGNAVAGVAGLAVASATNDMFRKFNMGGKEPWAVLSENTDKTTLAFWRNNKDLEKSLGIKQGEPMTIAEADRQSANPNYGKSSVYGINCATTSAAYVLRLRGFDVSAKGNHDFWPDFKIGNKVINSNSWVSFGDNNFKIWKNPDGSDVTPKYASDWMKDNRLEEMSADDYKKYFEETCKDKGVYILNLSWKGGGGHATILQRDDDGLHFIEPQVYESDKTSDGRRNLDDLLSHKSGLTMYPGFKDGILRVDDKLFDANFSSLFNTK